MGAIVVDETRWPIILARFDGNPTDKDVERFLFRSDLGVSRKQPYALVMEALGINTLSSSQRELFANWVKSNEAEIHKYCVGQVYVVGSVLQRMVIRSIFMVQRMPAPYVVLNSLDEAWGWCLKRFEERGVEISEDFSHPPC